MSEPDFDDRLADYVPVNERIAEFYRRHPEGRIVSATPITHEVADRMFVAVTVSVFRGPQFEAELPAGVATAWEKFPGTTPYTRHSEAMNAETSAIGRALAAAGIHANRAIASAEDVNRAREHSLGLVHRAEAKGQLMAAAEGDAALAAEWWAQAFPDNPDMIDAAALEVLERLVQAAAAEAHRYEDDPEGAETAERPAEGRSGPDAVPAGLAAARDALRGPGLPPEDDT